MTSIASLRHLPLLFLVAVRCTEELSGSALAARLESMRVEDKVERLARIDEPELREARLALAAGRPWRATLLLAPLVRDPARRTPDAVLLAARAAAQWRGWSEVQRLLGAEHWLDSLESAAGRELLARASLELGRDSVAAVHAAAAAALARDPIERGERLALLARALERMEQSDSARATYERAALLLPDAADWLRLRAMALDSGAARRAATAAALTRSPARERAAWAEARARERAREWEGAASAYDRIGAPVDAWRARWGGANDFVSRAAARHQLLAIITARGGSPNARAAVALFDRTFPEPTASEELSIARIAAETGPAERAVRGFARAIAAGIATEQDRFAYATVLSQTGNDAAAAEQFARVTKGPLAGRAAYQRARSLLRANRGVDARRALDGVIERFGGDSAAAASALFLRGDLASDALRDDAARADFRRIARDFPTNRRAAEAHFRAAIIAFVGGDTRSAAVEFDSLAVRYPASTEALGAIYWSGRSWSATGDTAAARERWRRVIESGPSYYAVLAARRLGVAAPRPDPADDRFMPFPAIEESFRRAAALERIGLAIEAGYEYDAIADAANESIERALATAAAFRDRGMAARGIAVARRALARGASPDARVMRLVYPVVEQGSLSAEAAVQGVDPALVAALIRQESSFDPKAISRAGARGLMQLMPTLGARLAKAEAFPLWDPALLLQPDVSIQLGTTHLAELLRAEHDLGRVLAAYNAGESRVARWITKAGTSDPEVFAERIPFAETRDYVRIVQRNRELYRALYDWSDNASELGVAR